MIKNFKIFCEKLKERNDTNLIISLKNNLAAKPDPERQLIFDEVFGSEDEAEKPKKRGR